MSPMSRRSPPPKKNNEQTGLGQTSAAGPRVSSQDQRPRLVMKGEAAAGDPRRGPAPGQETLPSTPLSTLKRALLRSIIDGVVENA